jgi:hypothetical protein
MRKLIRWGKLFTGNETNQNSRPQPCYCLSTSTIIGHWLFPH